jgi:two-component system cell cycle response regulator DivK
MMDQTQNTVKIDTDQLAKTCASPEPGLRPQDAYVLIVEDNLNSLALIVRLLNMVGIKGYSWKASGWHVLEHVRNLPNVDLILLDLRLPFEDGYEVLRKIRSERRLAKAWVVAVTAEATQAEMDKAREAGFDGFLGKPLDMDRFPDQLRRILQGEEVWELY